MALVKFSARIEHTHKYFWNLLYYPTKTWFRYLIAQWEHVLRAFQHFDSLSDKRNSFGMGVDTRPDFELVDILQLVDLFGIFESCRILPACRKSSFVLTILQCNQNEKDPLVLGNILMCKQTEMIESIKGCFAYFWQIDASSCYEGDT